MKTQAYEIENAYNKASNIQRVGMLTSEDLAANLVREGMQPTEESAREAVDRFRDIFVRAFSKYAKGLMFSLDESDGRAIMFYGLPEKRGGAVGVHFVDTKGGTHKATPCTGGKVVAPGLQSAPAHLRVMEALEAHGDPVAARVLSEAVDLDEPEPEKKSPKVRALVKEMQAQGYPVVSTGDGFKIARTDKDFQEAIDSLEKQAEGIRTRIEMLREARRKVNQQAREKKAQVV